MLIISFLSVFFSLFGASSLGYCTIDNHSMNCANLNMTDCPEVNPEITDLNMDGNNLHDLSKGNCSQWKHLIMFKATNNKISNLFDLSFLHKLQFFNISHNYIETVNIYSDSLLLIDCSYNGLTSFIVSKARYLQTLKLDHNILSPIAYNNIFNPSLLPSVSTIDVSYNPNNNLIFLSSNIKDLPHLTSLSIAGSHLSSINFRIFTDKIKSIKLDLSDNLISTLDITEALSVNYLDLSHNKLSFIDNTSMPHLQLIKTIDLSLNPFNCSCLLIPPFVLWMNEHKDIFINQHSTNCNMSYGQNIFEIPCKKISIPYQHWVITIVIVVALILVFIIAFGVLRGRRSGYIKLKDSRSNCLSYFWRNLLTTAIPAEPESVSTYQQAKLIVLCSSANTKWAFREIKPHLKIETQIINSKVMDLPSSNFILVIVHGDSDLHDSKLIKHVTFVLTKRNSVNIRLLLRSIPSQEVLESSSGLSQFINEEIMNKSHIIFDAEYPLTSIDRLNEWLHITDYPYSV